MDLKSLTAEFQNYRYSDKAKVENVELCYALWAARPSSHETCGDCHSPKASQLTAGIAAIRKEINSYLAAEPGHGDAHKGHGHHVEQDALSSRVTALECENKQMKSAIHDLKELVHKLQTTINKLSIGETVKSQTPQSKAPAAAPKAKEADDEIDLFGSDEEEDEEATKIREQRLKAYEEKKSKKPGLIAKSSVILDVKPWDDETDMAELEKVVRSIDMDGLLWGACTKPKFVPVGYGIKKLQIMSVVEDEKVSVEELQEKIEAFDDFVQSVDIAAFNKI